MAESSECVASISPELPVVDQSLLNSGNPTIDEAAAFVEPMPVSQKSTAPFALEEETRSSWAGDPPARNGSPGVAEEPPGIQSLVSSIVGSAEDSQNSQNSQSKSSTKKPFNPKFITAGEYLEARIIVTAETLMEYEWPIRSGYHWMLQEQVCDYLDVKSFKRKYPDLTRRSVDMDERDILLEKGVVTETQADLGLTAVKSDEVLDVMQRDYPDKYEDYHRVLKDRQRKAIKEKHQGYSTASVDKSKIQDFIRKAVRSAAEYNQHLNLERVEERQCCFDLQTFTVHYPEAKRRKIVPPKMGKYPVALIPGQYQDYYRTYTSQELKYLPLNTVLYGPPSEIDNVIAPPTAASDASHSVSGSDVGSDEDDDSSSSSSSSSSCSGSGDSNGSDAVQSPSAICKVCENRVPSKRDGPTIRCSECRRAVHYACVEVHCDDVEQVLHSYAWRCMECKTCSVCSKADNEDRLMFCDMCDRGYHNYCVGLKVVPSGRWVCRLCGKCAGCGATEPHGTDSGAQWIHDFKGALKGGSKGGGDSAGGSSEPVAIYCHKCRTPVRTRGVRAVTARS